jgi:hypothetical protein
MGGSAVSFTRLRLSTGETEEVEREMFTDTRPQSFICPLAFDSTDYGLVSTKPMEACWRYIGPAGHHHCCHYCQDKSGVGYDDPSNWHRVGSELRKTCRITGRVWSFPVIPR